MCVTIVGTYFLLNAENYHWHWTAFCAGASTCGLSWRQGTEHGCGRGQTLLCVLRCRNPMEPSAPMCLSALPAPRPHPRACPLPFTSALRPPAALYVMLYSVHYFVVKTKMTGFFQTAFYFGYTLMFCLGEQLGGGGPGCVEPWAAFRHQVHAGLSCLRLYPPVGPMSIVRDTCPAPFALPCHAMPQHPTAGLSTMCGAVGYLGSLAFVRRIFRNVKVD